jgi:hypothetical protein
MYHLGVQTAASMSHLPAMSSGGYLNELTMETEYLANGEYLSGITIVGEYF